MGRSLFTRLALKVPWARERWTVCFLSWINQVFVMYVYEGSDRVNFEIVGSSTDQQSWNNSEVIPTID